MLASVELLGQLFDTSDIAIVALLIVLEGVLSIDNALVLGLLAKRLPKHQQKKALTYGLIGAFAFRVVAIFTATLLLTLPIMKLLGGGYLLYIAIKYFFFETESKEHVRLGPDGQPILEEEATGHELSDARREEEIAQRTPVHYATYAMFWPTVLVIELTDIAFAIDSILAALAFIPPAPSAHTVNPKLWVVITGGMLGVVLMRFAAIVFIKLLEKFPRFETSAYLLVIVIGLKLALDWLFNSYLHPRPADLPPDLAYHGPLNFHDIAAPAFWIFWTLMLACFLVGFIPRRRRGTSQPEQTAASEPH